MTVLAFWVHDLDPFLVQFSENIGIRYYGLAYLTGFVAAMWLLRAYSKTGRTNLSVDKLSDLMVALVIGVLAGGRLGYFLLYTPEALLRDPLALLRVWDGGMASHGGFVGVGLALLWFARRERMPFLHLTDIVTSVAPAGLLFGRIANFINGELWGKVTDVRWAVIFPQSVPPGTPAELIAPRHPSQLYAAALEGLLLLAVLQFLAWRTPMLRGNPGRLTGLFLVGYAIARTIGELFREPDATLIMGLSRGTFYSIFVFAVGVYIAYRARGVTTPVATAPGSPRPPR